MMRLIAVASTTTTAYARLRRCLLATAAAPLGSTGLRFSSSSSSSSSHSLSAAELFSALQVLGLHGDATDRDIKDAFVRLVKAHHPDLNTTTTSTPSAAASSANTTQSSNNDPIIEVTKAYHLLKKTTETDRQFIIKQSRQSHYTGGGGFSMNEEQYAKAQKAYYGRKRPHEKRGAAAAEQDAFNAEFFSADTFAGQERTKFFNSRAAYMQRNRARMGFDSPPWKVEAMKQQQQEGTEEGGGATEHPFSKWQSLRLSFQYQRRHIAAEIAKLKAEVKGYKGFAGLDGSRYDSPASTARAQHKINQHPNLKQYILMTERAKERQQVDRAVGDLIFYSLYVVLGLAIVLLAREIYHSYYARKAYIEMKEQEIVEGRLRG